ncbi:unnamed protein product [Urochloa humidicola]
MKQARPKLQDRIQKALKVAFTTMTGDAKSYFILHPRNANALRAKVLTLEAASHLPHDLHASSFFSRF